MQGVYNVACGNRYISGRNRDRTGSLVACLDVLGIDSSAARAHSGKKSSAALDVCHVRVIAEISDVFC